MFFFNWLLLRDVLIALLVISAAALAIWAVRRKKLPIRIPTFIAAIPIGSVAILLALLMALKQMSGCHSHGVPVYSPNQRSAARVETFDAGATGGGTSVQLYSAHGFWTSHVFGGGWKSVEDQDLKWVSDRSLVIYYEHYDGYHEAEDCRSFGDIHVECVPKLPQ